MPTLIGILYFFHLFQNYLLKVVRKIPNMFLNLHPYTLWTILYFEILAFFSLRHWATEYCFCVPPVPTMPLFFFVFSMFTMFNVLCTAVSVSIVSLGKHINYQPKQNFQVIPAPVFLLKSNASLVICLILNCKITFQKTTILDHKHSIHSLVFLFKVPHWSIWQFM